MFFPKAHSNFLNKLWSTFGRDFEPIFGRPVKDVNSVESFLIGSTPAENDDAIVLAIVVHGAIRAV